MKVKIDSKNLREIRVSRNLSQKELADASDKDQSTIQRFETKENNSISQEDLLLLAEKLNVEPYLLWGEIPDKYEVSAKTINNHDNLYDVLNNNFISEFNPNIKYIESSDSKDAFLNLASLIDETNKDITSYHNTTNVEELKKRIKIKDAYDQITGLDLYIHVAKIVKVELREYSSENVTYEPIWCWSVSYYMYVDKLEKSPTVCISTIPEKDNEALGSMFESILERNNYILTLRDNLLEDGSLRNEYNEKKFLAKADYYLKNELNLIKFELNYLNHKKWVLDRKFIKKELGKDENFAESKISIENEIKTLEKRKEEIISKSYEIINKLLNQKLDDSKLKIKALRKRN